MHFATRFKPREVNEIVTFVHVVPDPEWRGWLLHSKKSYHSVIQMPNTDRTSSIPNQHKAVDKADQYTMDEVHSNYDIWTGSRSRLKN